MAPSQQEWTPVRNEDGSWKFQSVHGGWLTADRNGTVYTVKECDDVMMKFWIEDPFPKRTSTLAPTTTEQPTTTTSSATTTTTTVSDVAHESSSTAANVLSGSGESTPNYTQPTTTTEQTTTSVKTVTTTAEATSNSAPITTTSDVPQRPMTASTTTNPAVTSTIASTTTTTAISPSTTTTASEIPALSAALPQVSTVMTNDARSWISTNYTLFFVLCAISLPIILGVSWATCKMRKRGEYTSVSKEEVQRA